MTKFRTAFDGVKLKSDAEHYEPGTSKTEPCQVECIESLVKRCLRDPESIMNIRRGWFVEAPTPDVFEKMDPTTVPGFDLADVTALEDEISQELPTTASAEQAPISQATSEPAVDNSVEATPQ